METIKAKDLRIGNWITGIDGQPMQVTANTIMILEMAPKWANGQTGYKPIPITEQWLTDAGFKKAPESDRYGGYIAPDGWRIINYEDAFGFQISMFRTIKLEHIHQLQNLLASFGLELIFNR